MDRQWRICFTSGYGGSTRVIRTMTGAAGMGVSIFTGVVRVAVVGAVNHDAG